MARIIRHPLRAQRCFNEDWDEDNERFSAFSLKINQILTENKLPDSENSNFLTCNMDGTWSIIYDIHEGVLKLNFGCSMRRCKKCHSYTMQCLKWTQNKLMRAKRHLFNVVDFHTFDLRSELYKDERSGIYVLESIYWIIRRLNEDFAEQESRKEMAARVAAANIQIPSRNAGVSLQQMYNEVSEMDIEIPNEFLCPISMSLMMDPIICADGHTYDRANIEKWLRRSDKSPKTGDRLESKITISNHALKNIIDDFVLRTKSS